MRVAGERNGDGEKDRLGRGTEEGEQRGERRKRRRRTRKRTEWGKGVVSRRKVLIWLLAHVAAHWYMYTVFIVTFALRHIHPLRPP